jgi:hypothetical protein
MTETEKHYGPIDTRVPQIFPPLVDIINKPPLSRPIAGVYTWKFDWISDLNLDDEFKKVGWKVFRISSSRNQMLDDDQAITIMNYCEDTGAEIMYTLFTHERTDFGVVNNLANDQLFFDDFNNFADQMIGKYGPNGTFWDTNPTVPYHPIMYWEIYNEPNEHYFLGEPYNQLDEEGKADLYARLLLSAYAHIRANPDWNAIKVVGGSVSRGGITYNGQLTCFDEMVHIKLAAYGDASAAYDIWSNHPYLHDNPPDTEHIVYRGGVFSHSYSLPNTHMEIRRVMDLYGNQNKPIYYTEIGWHRSNGHYPEDARDYHNTEREQAAYVIRLYLISIRLGVEAIHVMMSADADSFNGGFYYFSTGWPRKIYRYESATASENYFKILPKPGILSAISDGINGYYAYVFDPNTDVAGDDPVIVAWNVEKPIYVKVPGLEGKHTITDMLGNSIHIVSSGPEFWVKIGPYPIYVH